MMARKKTTKKTLTKKKTGEALAKDAIATIDENLARIDGETSEPKAPTKTRKTKKPATPRTKKTTATKAKRERKPKAAKSPKKASGLDLAAKVLEASKEPLSAKEIADRVIRAGWKTDGKTPHATLYSAMLREMNTKKKEARFIKVDRGRFTFNPRTKVASS